MIRSKFNIFIVRCIAIFFWFALFMLVLFFPLFREQRASDTLYVFSWAGIIDPLYIKKFEKSTGKKVKISYYENNQELLVKLKATAGKGYDLIVPSDYTVNILRQNNLLEELDKHKLTFLRRLNPSLLNHYFDITRRYLYQDKIKLSLDEIEEIKKLLKKQHAFVSVYTDARADYLLATHNCALVVASSSYMWRGMKEHAYLDFMIPKEGTIVTIENFAIPKESKNKDLSYEFLNFIYSLASIEHHFNYSAFSPTTVDPLTWGHLSQAKRDLLVPTKEIFKKFHFLEPSISEQDLYDAWVTIKS